MEDKSHLYHFYGKKVLAKSYRGETHHCAAGLAGKVIGIIGDNGTLEVYVEYFDASLNKDAHNYPAFDVRTKNHIRPTKGKLGWMYEAGDLVIVEYHKPFTDSEYEELLV